MAKVDRDNLPRGAELLTEHVFDPISGMATSLGGNVVASQLQRSSSTFRLNLSIPYISAKFFWANPGGWFYVPFCLPPLQEYWAGSGAGSEYPVPELNEVGFSFDQRSEPALPADRYTKKEFTSHSTRPASFFVSNIHEGKAVYERAGNVDIKLSIFEKSQHFYSPQAVGSGSNLTGVKAPGADNEVFAVTISGAEISARASRNNPACYPDLSVAIDPKRTYMFAINADGLVDDDSTSNLHTALVSVNVSLKFKMPLMARDSAGPPSYDYVQNVPRQSYGSRSSDTISVTVPGAGDVVSADTASGVSTGLEKIDSRLRHKIYGGYQDFSSSYVGQQISEDAGYEVIAVPLFSNTALGEVVNDASWARMEDYAATPGPTTRNCLDRAVIPITSPMTIHHVLFTNSFLTSTAPDLTTGDYVRPVTQTDLVYQVGVGIVAGQASDSARYTQVAYGEVRPDNAASTGIVDFMDMGNVASHLKTILNPVTLLYEYNFQPQRWEQSIFAIPLVRGTRSGEGYVTQGTPFFAGEGAANGLATTDRTDVGDPATPGTAITPLSGGTEQFIEVRMKMLPDTAANGLSSFSGCGGSWVYIVGKKHMRT